MVSVAVQVLRNCIWLHFVCQPFTLLLYPSVIPAAVSSLRSVTEGQKEVCWDHVTGTEVHWDHVTQDRNRFVGTRSQMGPQLGVTALRNAAFTLHGQESVLFLNTGEEFPPYKAVY